MHISNESRRNIILFLLAFFGIHVFRFFENYFHLIYTRSITEFLSTLLVISWMTTINIRILKKEVRQQMLIIGGMLIFYFCLLMAKYCWVDEADQNILRWIWNLYYVPMTIIPSRYFIAARLMGTDDTDFIVRKYQWIHIAEIILCLLYATNSWHQLLLVNNAINPITSEAAGRGIVYWIYIIWTVVFFSAAFLTMMRKCRLANRMKYIWLPLLPMINGTVYFILYGLGKDLHIGEFRWMNMGQMFAFMVIGYLEGCIQIGIFQSNSGYEKLFSGMSGQARITNHDGRIYYSTTDNWPEKESSNHRILRTSVQGGEFCYVEDLTNLNKLNQDILEATEKIAYRNEYLQTQSQLFAEQNALEERSRLYDKIQQLIFPQTKKIKSLLAYGDDASLSKATIMTAYIKRRSNLEILSFDHAKVPVQELELAIRESADYLNLSGTETVLVCRKASDDQEIDISKLIRYYEVFEQWLEICIELGLEKQEYLYILLDSRRDQLTLRIRQYGKNVHEIFEHAVSMKSNSVFITEEDGEVFWTMREEL